MTARRFAIVVCAALTGLAAGSAPACGKEKAGGRGPEAAYERAIDTTGIGGGQMNSVYKAMALIQKKKLTEADLRLNRVLAAFRRMMTDSKARYVCFRSKEDYQRFVETVRKLKGDAEAKRVARVSWGLCEALQLKARIASQRLKWTDALKLLDQVMGYAPCAAWPYCERGYILNKHGKPAEALEAYKKASTLAENFDGSWHERALALRGMGFAQIELGQLQAAKASFQKSLKIEPKNKLALSELKYIAKLEKEQAPKDTPPKE